MKNLSNFELQYQKQYFEDRNPHTEGNEFTASGAVHYFREYDYSATYFADDKEVYYGKRMPLEIKTGVPLDDEDTEFDTYYTYAKMENK